MKYNLTSTLIAYILLTTTSCSSDNRINPKLSAPKIEFEFAIYDENSGHQYINRDTIFFSNIEQSVMVTIRHLNITDPDVIVDIKNSDFQGWVHTIPTQSEFDKEVLIPGKNATLYWTEYGPSDIAGIEAIDAEFSFMIPVKVGIASINGNDTLELENLEFDFIDAEYHSPMMDLNGNDILYVKKF
ncbi:hypothetical protein [Ekhidna sp.]|uniref:hypothetical protein n=1 Tax=Ekhidna sp. TaxID=2608089 RepID=UPI003CCBC262